MNCERCSEILVELIHGELSPGERDAVMEHLRGCEACMREYEEYAEIRRAVTGDATLPEPSPEVLARLSRAAREKVAADKRPFWKKWPYSPILIPALSTAIALMVWFYYGHGDRQYTDTISRDVMASKVKEPGSHMETRGQAVPELKRESARPPESGESSLALREREDHENQLSSAPAAPPPPPQSGEMYSASDEGSGVTSGTEEDADNKESALLDTASKKPAPEQQPASSQTEAASVENVKDYSGQLRLALRQQTEGDCESSIKTNEALLKSTPQPPGYMRAQSYRSLAECYEKEGNLDKALMNYTQLQQVSPEETSFANTRILEIKQKSAEKLGNANPTSGPVN